MITPREFCERIYCGVTGLDAFDVDPATGRIAFGAQVTSGEQVAEHRVEFTAVRDITRRDPRDPAPGESGDRIELSVIEIERESDGWRLWFNPWYLEEIEFRCAAVRLDGEEVVGSGRWLQDDLPRAAG